MVNHIPLFGVVHSEQAEAVALEVMRSGRVASGPYIAEFEKGLAALTGHEHVITTCDMTSAMLLALRLAGVCPGDEVLTTSFACLATNSAIAQCGATPAWVDVRPDSVEIDIDDVARKIGRSTKAVILYHVAGYPGPARQLANLCRERGIALIEDCDNALGARRDGDPVGRAGDFAVYSFYPNRQINCTEGGAVACRNPDDAARARRLRRFGIDASTFRGENGEINPSSDVPELGWAITMNNLCAAIGTTQLASVAGRIAQARANSAALREALTGVPGVVPVPVADGAESAYWVFLVLADHRDVMLAALKEAGVMCSSLHQRNDVYSGFKVELPTQLPATVRLQDRILALPCGWWLQPADICRIGDAVLAASLAAHRA